MKFLGRQGELRLLRSWQDRGDGHFLTVLYGRRRIGKTRLVEEAFNDSTLIKFEGLEGQSTRRQQEAFLDRLAAISGRKEHRLIRSSNWTDILILLSDFLRDRFKSKPVVVFFDEFQWMAAGRTKLVSALKYVWDNHFTRQRRVHLILCGSVGSFLVKKVLRSKALYGRVDLEIRLRELSLPEMKAVFHPPRSLREVAELYMALGGVPKYLELVDPTLSAHLNLQTLCFSPHGFLAREFDRLFISHFGSAPHYRILLQHLAGKGHATREQLQKACNLQSGGRISEYLEDLQLAGFVESYASVAQPHAQRGLRYRLADNFLLFFFRFIAPSLRKKGSSSKPSRNKYAIWRGLAFEYLCYQHAHLLAQKLGFAAVDYECGSWYSRSDDRPASQIDLLFLRADSVITLCEIKFRDEPIGKGVIEEVERKRLALPNPRGRTVETVLVTASAPSQDLLREGYFQRILSLDELFGS